ncbi:MAG: ABC transporter substrate-binding protein [Steroidobacteraceae bacterium]|nr:ABC transporter substrate-binding protein [Steroidobacteraceae bacterium]
MIRIPGLVTAAACAALLLAPLARAADPVDASGPGQLIESAATSMLKALDANRDAYRKDPRKVEALVDEVLLPHFDTEYAARLVLATHWRTATPAQRERFIKGFYNSLLRNYGSALAEFTGDRLKVLPAQIAPDGQRATVRTEVKRDDGSRVPVNYSLRKTADGWKAWDVTIEGISYVKSFREDFGAEIDGKGLDAVIERLEKGDTPVAKPSA